LEDFKAQTENGSPVTETIAQIRHQHYEEKRKAKLELIERTIRNGLLANLVVNFNTGSKGGAVSKLQSSLNSPGRSKSLRMAPLPARTLPLSPQLESSFADIPLKEPIDIEFKLNKKLAKQLYLREMEEKVKQHKDQQMAEREQLIQKKQKKE
jgi:hypothetical protein